eukprot:Opistho-2@69425
MPLGRSGDNWTGGTQGSSLVIPLAGSRGSLDLPQDPRARTGHGQRPLGSGLGRAIGLRRALQGRVTKRFRATRERVIFRRTHMNSPPHIVTRRRPRPRQGRWGRRHLHHVTRSVGHWNAAERAHAEQIRAHTLRSRATSKHHVGWRRRRLLRLRQRISLLQKSGARGGSSHQCWRRRRAHAHGRRPSPRPCRRRRCGGCLSKTSLEPGSSCIIVRIAAVTVITIVVVTGTLEVRRFVVAELLSPRTQFLKYVVQSLCADGTGEGTRGHAAITHVEPASAACGRIQVHLPHCASHSCITAMRLSRCACSTLLRRGVQCVCGVGWRLVRLLTGSTCSPRSQRHHRVAAEHAVDTVRQIAAAVIRIVIPVAFIPPKCSHPPHRCPRPTS